MQALYWPLKRTHWNYYLKLIRFDRPIGTLLLLYPCLTALVVAGDGAPSIKNIIIFSLGTFLMRSAGCAVNDYADRDWDGQVARTSHRPLAQKVIQPSEALMITAILCIAAFCLVLLTNWQTIQLSFIGAALALLYPFTKRFTHLPQLFLGAAFAWSVPMAFSAENTPTTVTTWLLFMSTVLWTVAYDTMYAMADREDDLTVGIRSSAILFGKLDKIFIGAIQILVAGIFWLIGQINELGLFFNCTLALISTLFIYQQFLLIHRIPDKCFKAFLNNQWVGLLLLLGVLGSLHL